MVSEQVVVFQLVTGEYAIPIAQIKEIIRYNGATKLPDTPGYMDGMITLRGKVIAVIDLAKRLGLVTETRRDKQVIIVEIAGQEIGLAVDMVMEIIHLEESEIETANKIAQPNEFITSIGKVGQRLLIILNLEKLFKQDEMKLMRDAI